MSILIKGMDMPDNCFECPCCNEEQLDYRGHILQHICQALIDEPFASDYERRPDCPLAKIPTPHGNLIDRDDLLAYFDRKAKGKTAEEALKLLYTALKAYPTVIEAEDES